MLITDIQAPDFTLPDQNNIQISLSGFKGQWVILYFYPKDMTPGCTTEACSFQSGLPDFKNLNAVILGVSKDSVTSHNKFAKKYHLDFLLLSDENSNVCETYETLQMKKNYGREYQGVVRSTYLINPSGIITKVYHKVDVNTHHTELRQDIENFRKV